MGTEVEIDESGIIEAQVVNTTGLAIEAITAGLATSPHPMRSALVDALTRWTRETQGPPSRLGGILDRDKYVSPDRTFHQIWTARDAMADDVVEGVADGTEAVLFKELSIFAPDEEEQDVWQQWAERVDLAVRFREIWRQVFTDSQCVVGMLWGTESFKLRGETEAGNQRRKAFPNVVVPTALTVLDTLKVTPVGTLLFGRERLAYIATWEEAERFDEILALRDGTAQQLRLPGAPYIEGLGTDDIVEELIERRYWPDAAEAFDLQRDGVDCTRLYLLKAESVFRHTLTRSGHKRFADVRMRSVFPLLDLKHQLRHMDRAHLIGGSNFIILIKKGSDDHPATPAEIANLQANVHVIARVPVIVGDHRLSVEIVTPKLDVTLNEERHDTLDKRIAARLYQHFLPTGGGDDDPLKLGKVVSEGLEARRSGIRHSLEQKVCRRMVARNSAFTDMPTIDFWPDQISLAFDEAWASFLLELRMAREISRESILGQFGFNQGREAQRRKREKTHYDDTFGTINPHGSTAEEGGPADETNPAKRAAGRTGGGMRRGGGAAPGSGQGKAPRNPLRKSD